MKKRVAVILVALLTLSLLSCTVMGSATPSTAPAVFAFPRNAMTPRGPDWIDATVEMLGEDEIAVREAAAHVGSAVATGASPRGEPAVIGELLTITVTDFALEIEYDETFVVVLEGTHGIVLVEEAAYLNYDPGTDEYVFANPYGTGSPEYPFCRVEDRIATSQLLYLLDQFDTVIYPTVTAVFGEPLPRGSEGQKTWILIHNIRDVSYYVCTVMTFVAGYFSASEDAANNKNMMHIDSFNWAEGTGPSGERPFFYEGAFAHEFEHLVHFDQDPDEPSWVDEGLADLAMLLCGYGQAAEDHLAYYMVYHPITSLTYWGGGVEDYGASYLFQLYLYEQYGGTAFVSALVQEPANGIPGIENTLTAFGHRDTFDEIFDNWAIANYIDDTRKAGGKYGYDAIDIGTMDTWGYTIEYALRNFWWGPPEAVPFTAASNWCFGLEPQPYTVHYFRFTSGEEAYVEFDGDDYVGVPAHSGVYEWYSDADAWAWRSFYQTFTIPATGATLTFSTFYEIEEDWDYGYVEVYDRDTGEWSTLDAVNTVDYVAFAQDNPNTPTLREPAAYHAAGRWHAFTGSSGGWTPVTMDLTPFAGHEIDLYFTTWQDGVFTLQMMYVDDIAIPEIGFLDDVEAGEDGWTSTGWYVTDGIHANGFRVTTIDTKGVATAQFPAAAGNSAMPLRSIRAMAIATDTQTGTLEVPATPAVSKRVQVIIISNHASHILAAHYDIAVEYAT